MKGKHEAKIEESAVLGGRKNETQVKIAADLVPLFRFLYKKGILRIAGDENAVQVSGEFFRETFPMYDVTDRDDANYPYELSYIYEGVRFFAVTKEP